MDIRQISKDFGKPVGKPDRVHLECATCGKVEGQFVTTKNKLTSDTGADAAAAKARGWAYKDGWRCPECR